MIFLDQARQRRWVGIFENSRRLINLATSEAATAGHRLRARIQSLNPSRISSELKRE